MMPLKGSFASAAKLGANCRTVDSVSSSASTNPKRRLSRTATIGHVKRIDEAVGKFDALDPLPRERHFNSVARLTRGEETASRVEAALRALRDVAVFPEDVGAGEGGVATEVDLGNGREPAKAEAGVRGDEKGRLGEIHLRGDRLASRLRVLDWATRILRRDCRERARR